MSGSDKVDVLLLGAGGREHALLAKLAESPRAGKLWVAPGNGGMLSIAEKADVDQGSPVDVANFAREHGISTELAAALDALLVADEMPVAVGMMDSRLFLVNASVGLYPDLLEERELAKRRFGRYRIVAFIAGLYTLLSHGRSLELNLTGFTGEREGFRGGVEAVYTF